MSFNKEKTRKLIRNESECIEDRCDGYKEKLLDAIVEILRAEREHKVQSTTIQKKINAACLAAGDFLMEKRDTDNPRTEATQ